MINAPVFTASLAVVAIYISVRIAMSNMVGDLDRVRSYSINRLYHVHGPLPVMDFLQIIEDEQNVLLFKPNKSNLPLTLSFWLFAIVAAIGTVFPLEYSAQWMRTGYVAGYSIIAATLCFFLWYDYRYYDKFRQVANKFPVPAEYDQSELNVLQICKLAGKQAARPGEEV